MIVGKSEAEVRKMVNNITVLSAAVQLGTEVLRDMVETGALGSKDIKGAEINVAGVRNLLTATIVNELRKGKK